MKILLCQPFHVSMIQLHVTQLVYESLSASSRVVRASEYPLIDSFQIRVFISDDYRTTFLRNGQFKGLSWRKVRGRLLTTASLTYRLSTPRGRVKSPWNEPLHYIWNKEGGEGQQSEGFPSGARVPGRNCNIRRGR